MVKKQKLFIQKSDLIQTIGIGMYTTMYCLVLVFAPQSVANYSVLLLFILEATILIIAVLRMRSVVANFGMNNPNEKLVALHISVFCVMMVSFLVSLVFKYKAD